MRGSLEADTAGSVSTSKQQWLDGEIRLLGELRGATQSFHTYNTRGPVSVTGRPRESSA